MLSRSKSATAVQVPVYSVTCLYFGRIDSIFYDFVALSHFFWWFYVNFFFAFLILFFDMLRANAAVDGPWRLKQTV